MALPLFFSTVAVALISLTIGGLLLRRALRGRRFGTTPLCAVCAFDQTGRPADSHRCSECGANLDSADAIVVGHRHVRVGLAIAAAGVLMVGLVSGVMVVIRFDRTDLRPIFPLAWLEYRAQHASPSGQAYALAEIENRWRRRELNDTQCQHLLDLALKIQADASQPWQQQWGDWVESAHVNGKLTDEQWKQYAEHVAPVFTTTVRPKIAYGSYLPYTVDFRSARSGGGQIMMHLTANQRRIWIDDQPLPLPEQNDGGGSIFSLLARGGMSIGSTINLPAWARTAGKHHLRVRQHAAVAARHGELFLPAPPDAPAVVLEWGGDFEVLPPGVSPVALVADPAAAAAVQSSVSVESLQVRTPVSAHPRQCSSTVRVNSTSALPVDVAFDVIATHQGREWTLGHVAFHAGASDSSTYGWSVTDFPADLAAVDVAFRASPSAAEGSRDITSIWDGTFTQTNVKIIRD